MSDRQPLSQTVSIRFGNEQVINIDAEAGALIAHVGCPEHEGLDDPLAAVEAALIEPLGYPPLASAVVPTDAIAITVEQGVPQVASIIGGVVRSLVEANVSPDSISIVLAPDCDDSIDYLYELGSTGEQIHLSSHQPQDPNEMAYLAAAEDATPIYLNRRICDADLVISIGTVSGDDASDEQFVRGSVFPSFADAKTRDRFLTPAAAESATARKKRAAEVEEATWLLGARFTVQIVPGPNGEVLQVLAGDLDYVGKQANESFKIAWDCEVPQRGSLVVAAISGGIEQQTWLNVVRGVVAASRIVDENGGGSIAVVTELAQRPGPSMMRIMGNENLDDVEHEIADQADGDAVATTRLIQALRCCHVYLLSELSEDQTQSMGFGYIDKASEVANLCQRSGDFILLSNAQHVWPRLADESEVEAS